MPYLLLINVVYSSSVNELPENNKVGLNITENEFIAAVTDAFETVEHMMYDNPTVTNEKLKYIYAAAKKNSESTSKWANEQLIQFTASACHNMCGLNQFLKGDAKTHGIFVGRGLMQFWGNEVYREIANMAGGKFRNESLDDYSRESIDVEYRFFLQKYFTPMHNNKEASTNLMCFLQTIKSMAWGDGKCIEFNEKEEPFVNKEILKSDSNWPARMERRFKFYGAIKKRLNV